MFDKMIFYLVIILSANSCTDLSKEEAGRFVQEILDNRDLDKVFEEYNDLTNIYLDSVLSGTAPNELFHNSFNNYKNGFQIVKGKTYSIENEGLKKERFFYFNITVVLEENPNSFENVNFIFKEVDNNWLLSDIVFNQ